jgi:hypothetical protein
MNLKVKGKKKKKVKQRKMGSKKVLKNNVMENQSNNNPLFCNIACFMKVIPNGSDH